MARRTSTDRHARGRAADCGFLRPRSGPRRLQRPARRSGARPPVTTIAISRRARIAFAATASLSAFSAAALGAGLGRGLVTTYLPVLLDDIRDAPGLIGTVMLVNTAAGLFVPLGIGLWSDRLHSRGRSRTGPFILGGSALTAGGLVAIALGHASTYLFLALAAAMTYAGLNAVTTAHRALIPETFGEGGRAAATGAEEFAMLAGTLIGVVAGGFLLDLGTWTPFAFGAGALPLLALPTYLRMRGRERPRASLGVAKPPLRYYLRAATRPGIRLLLGAQLLWVMGYIGSAPFFAVRSIASAIAVPAAGWTIHAAGSYRALFVAGGAVALLAVVPLAGLVSSGVSLTRPTPRRTFVLAGGLAAVSASLLGLAALVSTTRLAQADADVFDALYGLGGTPRLVDTLLVHPHIENYLTLTLLTAVAAVVWRPEELIRILMLVPIAGLVSFGIVRVLWGAWERPRPEEVLGAEPANGHLWAPYASFPSGHVVVTVALVTAIASRLPWLGPPLAVYAAVIAVTRISYGAHFPSDVVAGVVIGFATARVVAALVTETRLLPLPRSFPPRRVGERASFRLRRLGTALGVAAIAAFLTLTVTVGVPRSPEGGIIPGPTEETLQLGLLTVASLAVAAGLRYTTLAGAVLLSCATAIGVLAALEYNPLFAVGACAVLFVPGLLLLLGSPKVRSSRGVAVVAAVALALLVAGAFGAFRAHAAAYGPTHPESKLEPPPVTVIRWAWAGGVTETGFRVVAKLAHDGDARLLVGRDRDLEDAEATPLRRASHDDNDRVVSFVASGLLPGARYYYAVESRRQIDRARIGVVRTVPHGPFSFTIAVGGCAQTGSNGAVFDAIRRQNPFASLILGDSFYGTTAKTHRGGSPSQYERSLSRPAQAALYRTAAVDYIWDDHDYGPDDGDSSSPSPPAALATYRMYAPHYALPDPSSIYHSFVV